MICGERELMAWRNEYARVIAYDSVSRMSRMYASKERPCADLALTTN